MEMSWSGEEEEADGDERLRDVCQDKEYLSRRASLLQQMMLMVMPASGLHSLAAYRLLAHAFLSCSLFLSLSLCCSRFAGD